MGEGRGYGGSEVAGALERPWGRLVLKVFEGVLMARAPRFEYADMLRSCWTMKVLI